MLAMSSKMSQLNFFIVYCTGCRKHEFAEMGIMPIEFSLCYKELAIAAYVGKNKNI